MTNRCNHCGALLEDKTLAQVTMPVLAKSVRLANQKLHTIAWVLQVEQTKGEKVRLIRIVRKVQLPYEIPNIYYYETTFFGEGYACMFRNPKDVLKAFEQYRRKHPNDTLVRIINKEVTK